MPAAAEWINGQLQGMGTPNVPSTNKQGFMESLSTGEVRSAMHQHGSNVHLNSLGNLAHGNPDV